jgi:putative intracellular protease/amidase
LRHARKERILADTQNPFIGVYANKKETMLKDVLPLLWQFEYPFRTIDRPDLAGLKAGDFDALLFPGGWYFFDEPTSDRIRTFVREGGGFVGICCGQINACKLGLLPADTYSMLGIGPVGLTVADGEHPVMKDVAKRHEKDLTRWQRLEILRYNGFPMVLKEGANLLASYDLDRKLAAIAWADYGKGRVVAFSPHPEGKTCEPGEFKDRDKWPLVYDPMAMATARLLDNALKFVTRRS